MAITSTHMQPLSSRGSRYTGLFLILAAWFALSLALAFSGIYAATHGILAAALPIAIVTPIVVFAVVYAKSPRLRELLLGIDTRVLVMLHTWRMLGLGFVMLYAFDVLPAIFAVPAGLGDAAVAIWALLLSVGFMGGFQLSRRHLLAWNTFGIADFIVAVTIGSLLRFGYLHQFSDGVGSAAMGQLPLVLIPTFIVPLLTLSHILIYLQLKNNRERATRQ